MRSNLFGTCANFCVTFLDAVFSLGMANVVQPHFSSRPEFFIDMANSAVIVRYMPMRVDSGQWTVAEAEPIRRWLRSVHLLTCSTLPRSTPPPLWDILGHFRTFSTRNRGDKRRLRRPNGVVRCPVEEDIGAGVLPPIWAYFSCRRRNEFCFFWYEFCSFLLFFVRVLLFLDVFCFVFGEKPRFSAEKRGSSEGANCGPAT